MTAIEKLKKLNTAEVSDALDACGVEGALLGISTVCPGETAVGEAFTVKYSSYDKKPNDFKMAGNYIDDVPTNAVIVVDNAGRHDCTTWGDILTQVAIEKKIAGTVIFGAARDVDCIKQLGYPLFAKAVYMRSGKNRVYKSDQQCELCINGVTIRPGDIVMADDNGVVVIPKQLLEEVVKKAINIQITESKIIQSLKKGSSLADARQQHHYDQPWLGLAKE